MDKFSFYDGNIYTATYNFADSSLDTVLVRYLEEPPNRNTTIKEEYDRIVHDVMALLDDTVTAEDRAEFQAFVESVAMDIIKRSSARRFIGERSYNTIECVYLELG